MDMEKTFNNSINKNWIEWFIGFCDADGNFQVFPKLRSYVKKDGTTSKYYNIGYGFHISLSSKDLPLLLNIRKRLNNIGHIYSYPSRDEARFSVTKLEELKYLIENVFDLGHLIKKRLDLGTNVLDRRNRNNTRQNTYSLSISSKKDLLSLRELLENPLLNRLEGYKLVQYNNWHLNKSIE